MKAGTPIFFFFFYSKKYRKNGNMALPCLILFPVHFEARLKVNGKAIDSPSTGLFSFLNSFS